MKNVIAVFAAFALLSVASIAAATLTPKKIGYEDDGDWTYSTDLSYDGGCSTEDWACWEYYAPLRVCDADGVYARADTPSELYYFNAYYSTNDEGWYSTVDDEDCALTLGSSGFFYLCHGTERGAYNNWDAPGLSHHVRFMAFNFKFNSEQIMYRFEFLFDSCNQIE